MNGTSSNPRNSLRLPYIQSIFPEAKIIHIVRDGRDVACSLRAGCGGDSWLHLKPPDWQQLMMSSHGAIRCALCWRSVLEIALADLSGMTHLQVRYEDLVTEPQATVSKVLNFLALPPHEDVSQFCDRIQNDTANSYHAANQVFWYRNDHTHRIGRWKENLDAEEIREINFALGPLLERLGYRV